MEENLQMTSLAPYAAHPSLSRGRRYAPSASPTRSEFQRDRDRIIHSTAFRRLQHKTQVFLHHEGQHYRTRLTHTLEVSQIARSIARALRLQEDLAETIALAHDLGHTPFGHAGERVLHEKMASFGGFDHNIQALRVVTLLENRYAEHDGLNLTFESLEGILKHNGPITDPSGAPIGKYAREGMPAGIHLIDDIAGINLSTYASLEAQCAAIADDIAYNAHDIDDAARAGLITLDQLLDVPLVGPIAREVYKKYPNAESYRQFHEVQRRLITRMIEDVITTSKTNIATVNPLSLDDVRIAGAQLVSFSPEMTAAEKSLKSFAFKNIYRHPRVMHPVETSEFLVGKLFDAYINSGDMPTHWGRDYALAPDKLSQYRVVSDFVAGMTDPFAITEYTRLFDATLEF